MEKSGASYNINAPPSAPNGSQMNSPDNIEADPRFIDDGFQRNFGQKARFAPPPQQSFMPHQPDSNDSYCGRLFKNRRQTSSVTAGKVLGRVEMFYTVNR